MIGFVLVIVLLPDRIKLSMGWILLLFVSSRRYNYNQTGLRFRYYPLIAVQKGNW